MRFGLAIPKNNLDQPEVNSLVFPSPQPSVAHSSRGPGRRPLTAVTRVRIPYALPTLVSFDSTRVPRLGTIVPTLGTRRPARRRPHSLSDALFSKTQQRILGLLFGQPDRTFFTKEIIRNSGAGAGAAQRELARLEKSGLVRVTRVGNQKHYQANHAAPVFQEVRGIVMKTFGLAEPLREALQPLSRDIDLALVYGSIAKGEDHAGSDIDLLVVGDGLTLEQLFAHMSSVERFLGRRINPTLYTREEFRRRRHRNAFLEKVLAGPTLALIGTVE